MSAHHDLPVLLYVEDEDADVFFMKRALRVSRLPWRLVSVSDGRQAIAYFNGVGEYADREKYPEPDMLLLDLNLPFLSGFEVLESVRMNPRYRDIPVLIFSSSGRPEDRSRATALGADGYIQKPSSGVDFNQTAVEMHGFYASLTAGAWSR